MVSELDYLGGLRFKPWHFHPSSVNPEFILYNLVPVRSPRASMGSHMREGVKLDLHYGSFS